MTCADQEDMIWRKYDQEDNTFLGPAYKFLLNISHQNDATLGKILLWTALVHAPQYWKLSGIQTSLYRNVQMLVVKIPNISTPSLLKNFFILSMCMVNPGDLIECFQNFVLGQHTMYQRNKDSASTNRYNTAVSGGGGAIYFQCRDTDSAWRNVYTGDLL